MQHWEMLVRLSFKTTMALKAHPVGTDLLSLLMDSLFAQALAQLQAQAPAQSSRGSTMYVIFLIYFKIK